MKAIVYTSNTGFTREYATLLGEAVGLPVLELAAAKKALEPGSAVIYLGWLMAGSVKGYRKAAKRFRVAALGAVGMSAAESQLADIRTKNRLPESLPLFPLQGGFAMERLHGINKLMMQTMKSTVGKAIAGKENRTPEEDEMLELLLQGGSRVSKENLTAFLAWYQSEQRKGTVC